MYGYAFRYYWLPTGMSALVRSTIDVPTNHGMRILFLTIKNPTIDLELEPVDPAVSMVDHELREQKADNDVYLPQDEDFHHIVQPKLEPSDRQKD
jgi:hypothetical protein